MSGRGERVGLSHDVHGIDAVPVALFVKRALAAGAGAVKSESWATSGDSLPEAGERVVHVRSGEGENGLYERDGCLLQLTLFPGRVFATVAHRDEAAVDATLAWLRERLPTPDRSSHDVRVTFWTYAPHGPHPVWRSIAVPGWDDIADNYSRRTREKLEPLMRTFEPARGGQLVLWHGRAGTGKTYALRALAWEWRRWCEFHYIVDPDTFFGQHADYLMNVLLQPAQADFEDDEELEVEGDFYAEAVVGAGGLHAPGMAWARLQDDGRSKPWKLLMLEDTGELLTADARAVIGQGLSRFLNVVDGLIGQGLRVLVLVTTNEEIRTLHPAVARPGRCAANVEFEPLAPPEASAWLERHGIGGAVREPTTLATLYASANGLDPAAPGRTVGFAGA